MTIEIERLWICGQAEFPIGIDDSVPDGYWFDRIVDRKPLPIDSLMVSIETVRTSPAKGLWWSVTVNVDTYNNLVPHLVKCGFKER